MKNHSAYHHPFLVCGFLILSLLGSILQACGQSSTPGKEKQKTIKSMENTSEADKKWKQLLTPAQFDVLRLKGTEAPYTGTYDHFFKEGDYYCAACGARLFSSSSKYDSGCGWPAFFKPADSANLIFREDISHGMVRTEVLCARCGGHLGHLFNDGPKPTGERFCINSVSLIFVPKGSKPPPLR